MQQRIEHDEEGGGGKCGQHRGDGTMDDEHGYLDLSATEAILRAIYCGSRRSTGIGDAPHLCGRHPLNLTRNLISADGANIGGQ